MTDYYKYKADVPLLPGQTLGYSAAHDAYYAAGTPTPTQATKNTVSAPQSVDQPVKPAPVTVAYSSTGYVEGGSSLAVAQAVEAQAIATPGSNPVYVPATIEASIPASTLVTTASAATETFGAAVAANSASTGGGATGSGTSATSTTVPNKTVATPASITSGSGKSGSSGTTNATVTSAAGAGGSTPSVNKKQTVATPASPSPPTDAPLKEPTFVPGTTKPPGVQNPTALKNWFDSTVTQLSDSAPTAASDLEKSLPDIASAALLLQVTIDAGILLFPPLAVVGGSVLTVEALGVASNVLYMAITTGLAIKDFSIQKFSSTFQNDLLSVAGMKMASEINDDTARALFNVVTDLAGAIHDELAPDAPAKHYPSRPPTYPTPPLPSVPSWVEEEGPAAIKAWYRAQGYVAN
jgi:hypothetical protein